MSHKRLRTFLHWLIGVRGTCVLVFDPPASPNGLWAGSLGTTPYFCAEWSAPVSGWDAASDPTLGRQGVSQ